MRCCRPTRRAPQPSPGVSFVGRLGTYRYMDMDVTLRAALDTVRAFVQARTA